MKIIVTNHGLDFSKVSIEELKLARDERLETLNTMKQGDYERTGVKNDINILEKELNENEKKYKLDECNNKD